MLSKFKNDDGAVAILFAIVFLVLVGIAALAVDVGYWYTCKRQLQSAADAAALAGCQELAEGRAVDGTVNDYAGRNFTMPLSAPKSRVAGIQVGSNYVKVTVETDADVFLSRWLLGRGDTLIQAQSVAKVGWLAGGRAPVPWGLTVINIGELTATLGGETISMSGGEDGYWSGTFSPGRSGSLVMNATNGMGYTEEFNGLISVASLPSTGRITSIDVDKSTLTSGVDSVAYATVTLAAPLAADEKLQASLGTAKVDMSPVTSLQYECALPVPGTSDPYVRMPLTITLGTGKGGESVTCGVMVRRANYILQEVEVHPLAVRPGDSVSVDVLPLTFRYGVRYQLKVEGGAGTTGNYQALDFASLNHSECGYPDMPEPGQSGGADYQDNIVGNEGVVLHLGDIVTTLPGDKVGPTSSGISERLAGYPILSFDAWVAAGKPETKQLCIIPICEKTEDQTGRSVLKVVSFATFFIEVPPSGKDPVIGRFIEWTAPGWFVVDDKPSELAIAAVHLTDENLDF